MTVALLSVLSQVREKAKQIAKDKLESVRKEKVRQLQLLAERIQQEWEVQKQARVGLISITFLLHAIYWETIQLISQSASGIQLISQSEAGIQLIRC